jgi:ABC-2 type transport system permease protein
MRTELTKLRYLPTPRWTAAVVAAAVLIVGAALLIVAPDDATKYFTVPNLAVGLIASLGAIVLGVWFATLEFSSNTLQRTLTAEPDRNRVLASKLAVTLAATAITGLAVAAAAGGLSHLAANHAGIDLDDGDLAAALFGLVPEWISSAMIGFGFGLLSRSLGGGLAMSLAFVLAFDGLISFIPGASDYTYGQLSQDLSNNITGYGETINGLSISLLGTLAWCAVIVVPGWLRFLRGDLK